MQTANDLNAILLVVVLKMVRKSLSVK